MKPKINLIEGVCVCVCVRTCVATVDKVYWFVEKSDKNSDFTSHWGGDA